MNPKGKLSYLKHLDTGFYSGPDESNQHPYTKFFTFGVILFFHLHLQLVSGVFPSGISTKDVLHFSSSLTCDTVQPVSHSVAFEQHRLYIIIGNKKAYLKFNNCFYIWCFVQTMKPLLLHKTRRIMWDLRFTMRWEWWCSSGFWLCNILYIYELRQFQLFILNTVNCKPMTALRYFGLEWTGKGY